METSIIGKEYRVGNGTQKGHNSLKLLHLNIRSLGNKIDALDIELASLNDTIDILCITEHWLSKEHQEMLVVNNFKSAAMYCRQVKKGGGAGIYVNVNTKCQYVSRKDIDQIAVEGELELCAIELSVPKKIIVIVCYRPPKGNVSVFLGKMIEMIERVGNNDKQILLLGDFNINVNDKSCGNAFKEAVAIVNCKLLNLEPTRIARTKSTITSTVLDNIISNSPQVTFIANVDLGLSDHMGQLVYIQKDLFKNNNTEQIKVTKRSFNQNNIDTFLLSISEVTWDTVIKSEEVNEAFNNFASKFKQCFDTAFPCYCVRKIGNRPCRNQNWYTNELLAKSRVVKHLYQISRRSFNPMDTYSYNSMQKEYALEIKNTMRNHNSKIISMSKNKPKAAWAIIDNNNGKKNDSKGKSRDEIIMIKSGNTEITSAKQVANLFNKHFIDSANCINSDNSTAVHNMANSRNLFLYPLDHKEFYEIMEKITKKKTPGYDEVPPFILKNAAVYLAEPMIHIINKSFELGVFPEALKKSIVCPLHKKGEKTELSNYRPLALQSVFSKLIENAYSTRLVSFLEKNLLLNDCQHGFRKSRSTTTAISDFVNRLMTSMKTNNKSYGIFYDFTKAFDMVNHDLLLSKLYCIGVRGVANSWVESFLRNRKQVVKVSHPGGTIYSDEAIVNIGVPQGASISPILFIIYTNDLAATVTTGHLTTFADDTTQLINGQLDNIANMSNLAVRQMTDWSLNNDLLLNTSKTVLIAFNNHLRDRTNDGISPLIYLNGKSIKVMQETKFLGLTIDYQLKWEAHINIVAHKISSGCYLIKRIRKICDFNTAKLVYYSYVHSSLLYGIVLWGHSPLTKKLFILQKRALKYLANSSYDPTDPGVYFKDSTRVLFKTFGIMTLPCMYIFSITMYVISNKNLTKLKYDKQHKYVLRCNSTLYDLTTTTYCSGPILNGVKFFNHLPFYVKCKYKDKEFEQLLLTFLKCHCFYSIHDFYKSSFCKEQCDNVTFQC